MTGFGLITTMLLTTSCPELARAPADSAAAPTTVPTTVAPAPELPALPDPFEAGEARAPRRVASLPSALVDPFTEHPPVTGAPAPRLSDPFVGPAPADTGELLVDPFTLERPIEAGAPKRLADPFG